MTIERRVELDLSTAGLDARASGQQSPGGHTAGREADPQARQAFERAMAGGGASDAQEAEPATRVPDTPTSLFGRITAQPLGGASAGPERWVEPLGRELQHMVSQFAVGEGRSGGAMVRMELDDSVLPGVSIEIEESAGRLQVTFTCSVERSRERLLRELPLRGPDLASALGRDVLLRVQTDDPEDPCLFEVLAGA